ncbi:MAG: OmpA family protein [Treponema sp.]|jgi:outer membrane protein OmpA-like peptidoglycan-associated protein/flagellar hook assembly protein FlgD|nr:OmpA family protein [Treponema sp.]
MNNHKLKDVFCLRAAVLVLSALFLIAGGLYADPDRSPAGADAVPDLYSASIAGSGGFTTSTGGAPVSALNPAQGGDARRMIFDVSYLAIPTFPSMGKQEDGFMQSISLGALFPTRYGVFGGSLRYIGGFENDQFAYFPINSTFGGNLFASKELYPGMSLGLGLNFGFGTKATISGDIGFRYNTGTLGILQNFTIGVVLRSLGLSYFPTWLTPTGGVSFDLIHIEGKEDKSDPFVLNFAVDIGFASLFYPEYFNFLAKAGIKMTIAEIVSISASWPGGSGFNLQEVTDQDVAFPIIPSIGLSVKLMLPSGGERIAGGRLPSDGDLLVSAAFKPLYEGITAIGGGISWYAGVADTKPPAVNLEYPETAYFSPNNDGKKDAMEIPVSITDQGYVTSWKVEIKDEAGNVVRVIENKEQRFESFNAKEFFSRLVTPKSQVEMPSVIRWDGLRTTGELAADGKYTFTITATDDSGNTVVTPAHEVVIRNRPPEVSITAIAEAQRIFDPKGSTRSTITFTPRGSVEDAWESGMYNASGEKVRSFANVSGAPAPVVWDGRTDSGQYAPDGVYTFRISATDKAANSASAEMTNIILDSREAGAFVTSSVSAVAPARGQSTNIVNFNIRLLLTDGINNWKLELKDETGAVRRTFTGGAQVPAVQGWNGLTEQNEIREGSYTPTLTVNYTRGDVITAVATPVLVDVSGPNLTVVTSPEYFSPDNDGDNDELFIVLSARDASPIGNWVLEIRGPEAPYPVFRRIEGRGTPASRIVWDGRSDRGELVQSAMYYPYTFTAADVLGNSSSTEGRIGIDVLVIRDGDRLRIQIPAIVFRPNFADFEGLSREVVDNNNRIIRRIAQILNQFRDYRVVVEGHSNPTSPPGPARESEEPALRRISEARARAIVDLLVRNGVARSRLTATGAGGSNPIASYEDRDNWWKNRRVDFYLVK